MPVLKVKKNGVWEEIMGGSDSGSLNGGNADTLDGYHATHFATASNVATLEAKVGNKSVSEQINSAISNMSSSSHTHNTATTSSSGFMSSTDKSRLDSVYTAVNNHDIDISDLKTKVGNSAVSEQINTAISNISTSKRHQSERPSWRRWT